VFADISFRTAFAPMRLSERRVPVNLEEQDFEDG
jgi:hypothetical protein